jgi:monofunctional biosynthetic peptidoglycan transglycosylase
MTMNPILKKSLHYSFLSFKYLLITIKWLFIAYAVAFSIAGTIALYKAYDYIMTPVHEVKALLLTNPHETLYMVRYRESLGATDTLSQVFVPLDSISESLKRAVIAAEDDGFYTHPGFDIAAMLEAMEYNRINNDIKRGASTLTQQLAKNLFLTPERSFERKYKELMYTVLMEKFLGKKRILELYLNYAQWGKTLFGCEAASRYYYKKSCRNLTRMEAARLAAVLAKPEKVSPLNLNSTFIPKRIAVIANNLFIHHLIDDSGYTALTGNPPPVKDTLDTVKVPSSVIKPAAKSPTIANQTKKTQKIPRLRKK